MEILMAFVGGIAASLVAWFIVRHWLGPTIEFYEGIYKRKSRDDLSGYEYRIRLRNEGRRAVVDFEVVVRLRLFSSTGSTFKAVYIPLDIPRIPKIASHRGSNKRVSMLLRPADIDRTTAERLPSVVREGIESKTIKLEDLMYKSSF